MSGNFLLKSFLRFSLFLLLLVPSSPVFSQLSISDYQRADSIVKLNDLVYNQINNVSWIDSTTTFWFQVKTRNGNEYRIVDAAKVTKELAFDSEKLLQQLNNQLTSKISA